MGTTEIPEAELGGRRRASRAGVPKVRVELQLSRSVAAQLYSAARDRGQSVSRVGSDAIDAYLGGAGTD